MDSFCVGAKTIPDRASVHTQERFLGAISVTKRRGAAPLSKVERHIWDRCSHEKLSRIV